MMVKSLVLALFMIAMLGPASTFAQDDQNCLTQLPSRLQIDEQGRVLPGDSNNIRTEATSTSTLLGEIPGEAVFDVLDGPVCADGIVWWKVHYDGIIGWTGEGKGTTYWVESLSEPETHQEDAVVNAFCPGMLEPRLVWGEWGKVTPGDANNLRVDPSPDAALIAPIPSGHFFQVLSDPKCTDSGVWWKVEYEGMVGWTVEAGSDYFLEHVSGSEYTNPIDESLKTCPNLPPSRLTLDMVARITPGDNNIIRNAPSTFAPQVGTALSAAPVKIIRGPRCEANIAWWQVVVLDDNTVVGWTAEIIQDDYLIEPSVSLGADNLDQVVELNSFGRGAIVDSVWWTPDSRQLIVPTAAGLWYYNVPNLNVDPTFVAYDFPINKMAISSDNQQLALGSREGEIRIYSMTDQTWIPLPSISEGRPTVLVSLVYHESEHILQVKTQELGRYNTKPLVHMNYFNTDTLTLVEFKKEQDFPSYHTLDAYGDLAYSTSGDQIAEAREGLGLNIRRIPLDYDVKHQPVTNMEVINSRYGNLSKIEGIAYSPSGFWLATVARDGQIRLWDVVNAYEPYQSIEAHIPAITAISIHPRQDIIAIGSVDGVVRLWNRISGELLDEYRTESIDAQVNDLDFNADGSELAVAYNNSLRVWDVRLGAEKKVLGLGATQTQYSENGKYLFGAYLNPDADYEAWNHPDDQHTFTVWQLPSYTDVTANLNLSSDFDAARFSLSLIGYYIIIEEDPRDDNEQIIGMIVNAWQQAPIEPSFLSHDYGYLILVSEDSRDFRDLTFSDASAAYYLRFNEDFDYIEASYDKGSSSFILDTYEQAPSEIEFGNHVDYITDIDFDANGFYLASASADGVIKVWGIPYE